MMVSEVRKLILRYISEAGSYEKAARQLGLSAAYLNEVVKGKVMPGKKLLDALDLYEDKEKRQFFFKP